MTDKEQLDILKNNLYHLSFSMMDAPFHGFSGDKVRGVEFAIRKVLEGSGQDIENVISEVQSFSPEQKALIAENQRRNKS